MVGLVGREEEGEKEGGRRREGGQATFSSTQAWGGGGGVHRSYLRGSRTGYVTMVPPPRAVHTECTYTE